MAFSVGKAIRGLKDNFAKNYFLTGDDYFLQSFFIKTFTFLKLVHNLGEFYYIILGRPKYRNTVIRKRYVGDIYTVDK